jgi:hypothetical protein
VPSTVIASSTSTTLPSPPTARATSVVRVMTHAGIIEDMRGAEGAQDGVVLG